MAEEQGPPSAEELAQQLAEFKIEDFLVSSASTLVAIAFGKLDVGKPGEARLAIEALRALLPALEGSIPEQTGKDLHQALASLQLAYASAVSSAPTEGSGEAPSAEPGPGEA